MMVKKKDVELTVKIAVHDRTHHSSSSVHRLPFGLRAEPVVGDVDVEVADVDA